eukprot:scaffold259214_cov20-Tisochrysis_lutea.AAC.2
MSWQYPLGIVLEHMGDAAVVALAHGLKHCCVAKAVYSGRVCAGFQKHFHGVLQAGISQTKWARAWGQESAQHAPICTSVHVIIPFCYSKPISSSREKEGRLLAFSYPQA